MALQDKELKIYESVIELVNERYVASNITISEIAERSGIGKGTVYEYFKCKDEIMQKTFDYVVAKYVDRLNANGTQSFADMFKKFFESSIMLLDESRPFAISLMYKQMSLDGNGEVKPFTPGCVMKNYKNALKSYMAKMIEQGIKEGILSKTLSDKKRYFAIIAVMSYIINSTFKECDDESENIYKCENEELFNLCYESFIKMMN